MAESAPLAPEDQSFTGVLGQCNSLCPQALSYCRPAWPNPRLRPAANLDQRDNYVLFSNKPCGTNRTKPFTARRNACPAWLNGPVVRSLVSLSSGIEASHRIPPVQACYRISAKPHARILGVAPINSERNNTGNLRCLPCDFDKSETRGMA